MGAAFAGDQMGGDVGQDFVAGPAMHQRRRDIAHGAGRQEHRGLLAHEIGDAVAKQIDGGIVADLLVADFGARHRLAHPGRRAGLRVRQQVDADGRCLGIAAGRGVVGHWSRHRRVKVGSSGA